MTGGNQKSNSALNSGVSTVALALLTTLLAACSSIPDDMNPGNWVQGAGDWVSGVFGGSSDTGTAGDSQGFPSPQPAPAPAAETPKLGTDERPKIESNAEQQKVADSLAADRANAQYTEAEQRREGEPTRPLEPETAASPAPAPVPEAKATAAVPLPSPRTPPTPASSAATAPAPAPAKTLVSSADSMPAPELAPPVRQSVPETDSVVAPSARVQFNDQDAKSPPPPSAPNAAATPAPKQMTATASPTPQQVASAAPAPAPAPMPKQVAASVQSPVVQAAVPPGPPNPQPPPQRPIQASGGDVVGSVYRQRLAEFSAGRVESTSRAINPSPTMSSSDGGGAMGEGATPSAKVTAAHGAGGAHPLSALDVSKSAASFQVAEIEFGEGTAALSPAEESSLRAVADVYRDSKGSAKVGIVGHSNSERLDINAAANRDSNRSLAAERAAAVARALERLGVPAGKIYAGATGETAGDYAEIFVAY